MVAAAAVSAVVIVVAAAVVALHFGAMTTVKCSITNEQLRLA